MRDSDTYMAIIDEGREIEAKRLLLLVGEDLLGSPDQDMKTRLQAITDIDRLERMWMQLTRAPGWHELLDTP
jgi:hypothetical protein